MATNKKKKKKTTAKKTASKRAPAKPARKRGRAKKAAKKAAKKSAAANTAAAKRASSKKPSQGRRSSGIRGKSRSQSRQSSPSLPVAETFESHSGEQSGDLQGLSDVESADSESVDELLEEGNAFEAGVVSGVEEAGKRYDKEVHTKEVPEDDVPDEYLDQD